MTATRHKGSEANEEEAQMRERHHVGHESPEIRVQLAREAQTGRDAGHNNEYEVVKIAVSRGGKLQIAQVDEVKCLVNTRYQCKMFRQSSPRVGEQKA